MSSTMVSNYLEFSERFSHRDITNPTYQSFVDMVAPKISTFDNDLPTSGAFSPANLIQRPPVSRRHSSSVFNTAVSSKPIPQPHTTFSDSNGFLSKALAGTLEAVAEERFRSRAFSEGSSMSSSDSLHEQQQPQSATSRYKTELCRPFEENGKCKYGDKCQFAHGKHELRHMVRHPKYKTELCRTYHTSGLCPYGPRCHFIHNQDEPNVGVQRQNSINAIGVQNNVPASLSITNQSQLTHAVNRPNNLQLMSRQRPVNRLSSFSSPPNLNSPLEAQSPFFGVNEPPVLSPISPITSTNGHFFGQGKMPVSPIEMPRTNSFSIPDQRQATPPLSQFDVFPHIGGALDFPATDDGVFEPMTPPTPPDSDRESATGTPPGIMSASPCPQRLPIFRCLSQSE
ncbi:unnamed protein product [Clavelina lepadiformis]|uniref:C3H1-type domain-containing protein n=1 Tax=Clavelina lepadiformis TaxID=159417 RepID=A0ABP0GUT9_CLALP